MVELKLAYDVALDRLATLYKAKLVADLRPNAAVGATPG